MVRFSEIHHQQFSDFWKPCAENPLPFVLFGRLENAQGGRKEVEWVESKTRAVSCTFKSERTPWKRDCFPLLWCREVGQHVSGTGVYLQK